MRPCEILEHTADIGIRARGHDLPELFVNAALGMMSIIADPRKIESAGTEKIEVGADDLPSLLVAWLNETLYLIEARDMVFGEFEISTISETALKGKAFGETIKPSKHELKNHVKACTYHALKLGKEKDGWIAQVILDI